MTWRILLPCSLLVAALAGCGREAGERAAYPPSARLDSGNARYAAGDPAAALEHYRAAAAEDESNAAAWFGIYMAGTAVGDTAAAAAALRRVEALVPDAGWAEHPHPSSAAPVPADTL